MYQRTVYVDRAEDREGYLVRCVDRDLSIPVESVQLDAGRVGDSYILIEHGRTEPAMFWSEVFDVTSGPRIAKERLKSRALDVAERMALKYNSPIDIRVPGMKRDPNWRDSSE